MIEQDLLMTPVAEGARYLMQNQQYAFAGDVHLAGEILRLKEKHDITTAVETGTYIGTTTLWMAKHFDKVYTIEANEQYWRIARQRFSGIDNITSVHDDSAKLLRETDIDGLYFLDAHWEASCPLLGELDAFRYNQCRPPVIVLHDFFNPEHPEFQCDHIGEQRFDINWVGPSLDKIYGVGGWDSHYNDQATGAKVGVLFIERSA